MKVKELVKKLKRISGVMPVRFQNSEGKEKFLLRNFNIEDDGWELFQLGIGETEVRELDTELLKHYLDYGNKMNYASYFGKDNQFEEYEVEVAEKIRETSRVWRLSRAFVKNIDGTCCLVLVADDK